MSLFDQDILIDEEAFQKASDDLATLSDDLQKLSDKITEMLDTLSKGFDTPCGAKFYNSCEASLLRPLSDQRLVLNHVSQVLGTAKGKYQSIFDEYRDLNNSVESYQG